MDDIQFLKASDGTGEAVRAIVTGTRLVASTTLVVDSIDNWPAYFVATVGTLNVSTGIITPGSVTIFKGHTSGANIIIDEFAPGYADVGNSIGQVVVLKPNTFWADTLAAVLKVSHNDDGTLKTNIVTTAKILDSNVTPEKLLAGAGTTWPWRDWAVTFGNFTVGNATVVAKHQQIGKTIHFYLKVTLGTTSVMGTSPTFTLPVTASSTEPTGTTGRFLGGIHFYDASGGDSYGQLSMNSTTVARLFLLVASGTYVSYDNPTATLPWTWVTTDAFMCRGTYEAA